MPQRKITRGFERPSSLFAVVDRDPPPPCVLPTSKIDTIDFSSRGKEKSEEKSQGEENREEKVDYQTLRAQFEDTIRNHHFQRRYSKVSVLLLFWEREDSCDMQTLSEVQHLSLLFEETLNFRVHERSLNFDPNNKTRLQESIQKPLLDFAYEEDVTGSLLIIYYAGHGSPGVDGGLIDTGGNPRTSRNKLDQLVWAQCMDVIPNIDLADSLIIFDCCFAGTSCGTVARHPWPTKAFEFVGGTQSKRPTIPARRESFASALLRSLTELCDDKGGCTTARLCNQTGGVPDPPHNEKTPIADALVRSSHSFILWRSSKRCPGTFKMMLTMAGGLLAETATALVIPNYSAMKQNPSTSERLDGPQVDENGMGGAHLSWSSSNMLLISFWDPARRDDAVSRMAKLVRDPGPAAFVSSCAVLSLTLVYLMQQTRHHRYQNYFVISGASCGVVTGIVAEPRDRIAVDAFTKYLPAMVVAAHVLSLVFHQIFRSWRYPVAIKQSASPEFGNAPWTRQVWRRSPRRLAQEIWTVA